MSMYLPKHTIVGKDIVVPAVCDKIVLIVFVVLHSFGILSVVELLIATKSPLVVVLILSGLVLAIKTLIMERLFVGITSAAGLRREETLVNA